MRCAIYRRVSTDMQVEEGVSLDNQLHRLKAFAESQGWTIVEEYIDEGLSAKLIETRPGIQRMIEGIKQKRFDVLLVYKLDRLVRNVKNLHELLILMDQYDVKFRSCTEAFDTTTANGRLFITIIATLAQWERETTAERVYDNLKHRAENGKRNGGPPPYGYDYDEIGDLVINPEEAKWVEFMYKKYLANGTQNIAKMLNRYGVKTKKGLIWSDFSVKFILQNPIYCGLTRWNKRSPVKGKAYTGNEIIRELDQEDFVPIISTELFHEVRKVAQERSTVAFRSDNYYPFSGITKCSKCGNPFTGAFKNRKSGGVYRFYKCAGRFRFGICDQPTIAEEAFEEAFLKMLITDESQFEVEEQKAMGTIDLEEVQKQLQKLQSKKDRTKELYIDGDINKDSYNKRIEAMKQEEQELLALMSEHEEEASTDEIRALLQSFKAEWPNLSFESKKQAIHGLFESMTIELLEEAKSGKNPKPAVVNIKDYLFR